MEIKKEKIEFDNLEKINKVQIGEGDDVYSVDVKEYLSREDQQILISVYVDTYFEEGMFGNETDYTGAEWIFNYCILDISTSVNVGLKKFFVGDVNMVVDYAEESGLMSLVKDKIKNLPQVRNMIERVVSDMKQEKYSANGLLKQLMESIGGLDLDEKIKEMFEQIKVAQDEVKNSSISSLMDEGKQG